MRWKQGAWAACCVIAGMGSITVIGHVVAGRTSQLDRAAIVALLVLMALECLSEAIGAINASLRAHLERRRG